jgi:hypothetical protein
MYNFHPSYRMHLAEESGNFGKYLSSYRKALVGGRERGSGGEGRRWNID